MLMEENRECRNKIIIYGHYSLVKQISGKQKMVFEQLAIHMQKNEPWAKPHLTQRQTQKVKL